MLAPVAVDQAAARSPCGQESLGNWAAQVSTTDTNMRRVKRRVVKMSLKASRGIWDGEDEDGNPIGGMSEMGAGWRDTSSLASFRIGCDGIWSAHITWMPSLVLAEEVGGKSVSREVLARSWRSL